MAERRKANGSHKVWNGKLRSSVNNNVLVSQRHVESGRPLSPNGAPWPKNRPHANSNKQRANDTVRQIVKEEGRSARNLITWNVPVEDGEESRSRPYQRRQRASKMQQVKTDKKIDTEARDSSLGSKKDKLDLRARYWAFLFDNLERAVDEIYKTCEADESEVQCKEAIMMLEHSSKDFKSLIERLRVIRDFEQADTRPTSLAWELRKTSPGKTVSPVVPERLVVAATAKRILNFTKNNDKRADSVAVNGERVAGGDTGLTANSAELHKVTKVASYADRVRGIKITPVTEVVEDDVSSMTSSLEVTLNESILLNVARPTSISPDREDGWETVSSRAARHRSRITQSKSTSKTSSTESLNQNGNLNPRLAILTEPPKISQCATKDTTESIPTRNMKTKSTGESCGGNGEGEFNVSLVSMARVAGRVEVNGDADRVEVNGDADHVEVNGDAGRVEVNGDADLDDDEYDVDLVVDDDDEMEALQSKLIDELEVMDCALKEEQELEMNNNIEDAVTEQMSKDDELSAEVSTQTVTESEPEPLSWDSLVEAYKAAAEQQLSWGEMVDLEERTPGRSVQMHEKLSSPSRKASPRELSKRHEEKQAKAQQLREKLMTEKAERLRELARKVEIVTALKEEMGEQWRGNIEQKMRAAEEKRNSELRKRMQKAHDEETKANEIAFINSLEAQNKKHDIETKHQECQARLLDIAEERQRRNEEKAAKEAAVEERRKALEADRLARLQEMQDRRKQRETEFEQRQQEKEKERVEAARAKEKDREERIAAIKAQQQAQKEELRVKIQEKQDESARRHSEKLDQIREKAFEMSILRHSTEDHSDAPRLTPYDTKKLCTICNVLLPSEVHLSSHLRGKKHEQSMMASCSGKTMTKTDIEDFNLEHIRDAPSDRPDLQMKNDVERRKALKKRCKKLRQRMSARGAEYENTLITKQHNSDNKQKMQKYVKDINKVLQVQAKGPWGQDRVSGLDRALFEVGRVLDKKMVGDRESFCLAGGITSICRVLMTANDGGATPVLPDKSLSAYGTILGRVCEHSADNCRYVLYSNKLGVVVDFLAARFALLPAEFIHDDNLVMVASKLQDTVASSLMLALVTVLNQLTDITDSGNDLQNRKNDIISYLVSVGVVDRIRVLLSCVSQPIENAKACDFFDACLKFLHSTITLLSSTRNVSIFDTQKLEDTTLLVQTLSSTELCGTIQLLYSILLHTGAAAKRDVAPAVLSDRTVQMVTNGIELLNSVACLSLHMFQTVLGEEGTWLEFRHICSYLIWYCSQVSCDALLHHVIVAVGYFTILNAENQRVVHSGQPPTVLQQLCSLPFQYFSNARLTEILFPTLIACTYNNATNRTILENELSCALLANYMEENFSRSNESKVTKKNTSLKLENRFPSSEYENALKYFKC